MEGATEIRVTLRIGAYGGGANLGAQEMIKLCVSHFHFLEAPEAWRSGKQWALGTPPTPVLGSFSLAQS